MGEKIKLPAPQTESEMSVENAMSLRCSNRSFAKKPLSLRQIGQILWSAQGITREGGRKRAAPSAGATYPLEVHIGVQEGGVDGLDGGIYSYDPTDNSLEQEEGEYIPEKITQRSKYPAV